MFRSECYEKFTIPNTTIGYTVIVGLDRNKVGEIVATVNEIDPVDVPTSVCGYLGNKYHVTGGYLGHLKQVE